MKRCAGAPLRRGEAGPSSSGAGGTGGPLLEPMRGETGFEKLPLLRSSLKLACGGGGGGGEARGRHSRRGRGRRDAGEGPDARASAIADGGSSEAGSLTVLMISMPAACTARVFAPEEVTKVWIREMPACHVASCHVMIGGPRGASTVFFPSCVNGWTPAL